MRSQTTSSPGGQGIFVLALPLLLLAVVLVPWMAQEIARERYVLFVAGALFAFQFVISLRWWRLSVYFFFVYVMIEGFIINYFEGRAEINIIKDMQMIVLFLALAAATISRHTFPIPVVRWLPFFAGFALIYTGAVFNPNLPTILVGLVGMRVTLLFFLCFGIGYWFFRNRTDIVNFIRFQALLSVPICLFGILQYFTGPSLLLAISPGFRRAVFYSHVYGDPSAGSYFRTISTFASTAGLAQYLWVTIPLTLAFYVISDLRRDRILTAICILLQGCALLTTGSRGPFLLTFLSLIIAFGLMRRLQRGLAVTFALICALIVGTTFLGSSVQARFATVLDLDMVWERNQSLGVGQFSWAMDAPVEGLGAGRLTSASYRLRPDMPLMGVENQLAKVRLEAGLAGLALFALAYVVMFYDVARIARNVRNGQLRVVGAMAAGYLLVGILIFPIGLPLDVPPTNFFFWFLLGMIYAIVRIERYEALTAARMPPVPPASP